MTIDAITFDLPVIPSLFGEPQLAKYCRKCEHWRAPTQFPGRRTTCTVCKERETRSHAKYVTRRRVEDVARRYGLTPDELVAMRESQENLCAVCGQTEPVTRKNIGPMALSVDHDHSTGKVRGLLCSKCNWLIGRLEHIPPATVHLAWLYLEKHR